MTADEIRKRSINGPEPQTRTDDQICFLAEMVAEVAAQVAEVNEKLQDVIAGVLAK